MKNILYFYLADFSKEQKAFAQVLASFRFQPIGTDQTENELEIGECMCIEQYNILCVSVLVSSANSVQMFARLLMTIEDCRRNMVSTKIKTTITRVLRWYDTAYGSVSANVEDT